MACYHPIPAFQDRPGSPVKLWPPVGTATLTLPCGTCLGCRQDLATDWAHRAQLEASHWQYNSFLTLTYDDANLPEYGHLRPQDLTRFIKRLRRGIDRGDPGIGTQLPEGVRYLASGEYGETSQRPHFHLLLFNCRFTDQKRVGTSLYESETLHKYWKLGGHRLGELTGASANYVAQYSLKKLVTQGERHDENGEAYRPPFIRMSLKPPIGQKWTETNKLDLQHGYLVHNARKNRIPRGLKKQLAKLDPILAETATVQAQQHKHTRHNLDAAERIHRSKNALFHHRHL